MTRPRPPEIKRHGPVRSSYRKLWVLCEGEVTEKDYFENLKAISRNEQVEVRNVWGTGEKPDVLVAHAKRVVSELELQEEDEVWVVCDVDDHKYLKEAIREAKKDPHIQMAISNPCFELWALLHFQDKGGEILRPKLRELIQGQLPGYKKLLPFRKLHIHYPVAVGRAKALDTAAERDGAPGRNPTTGVWRLTERFFGRF